MYATVDDMLARYGEDVVYPLADKDQDDALDEEAAERSLNDATGLMNSYLGTRYPLPLLEVPDLLTRLCVDIALYWLADDAGGATEEKRQRFEDAIQWLENIAKGRVELGLDAPTDDEPGSLNDDGMVFTSAERLFSRAGLERY
ncbi:phage protein Gp36 family protein [Grimontia sp. SpTr1]|uniref:gp436 family protein n=1 Tax=Grimontia sp. SpTr1 TaxID=2995319 RepID=UPI00248BBC05|nr:phage protein Gp36 family protein [Grimontia sp. SpTr1]